MNVSGVDHIYLAVSDLAASERFYDTALRLLGFRKGDKRIAGEPHAHYFNPRLQISIRPARGTAPHDPYAPGLHHLCLQVPSAADVDAAAAALAEAGIAVTPPALYPEYAPDYYATFFSDPDGIRLELVGRTASREAVATHWDALTTFLNPLAALRARERAAGSGPEG